MLFDILFSLDVVGLSERCRDVVVWKEWIRERPTRQ